jgi:hypothetical protein
MSKSVATHVSHAKRFSHFVDARTTEDTTEATDETNLWSNLTRVLPFAILMGVNDVPWSYNADRFLINGPPFLP